MSATKIRQSADRIRSLFVATNRTKKAYLNSIAAGIDYGARMLVGFLLIPFLVSGLGDYMYGIWTVLKKSNGYLTASGARPTQALKCVIANKQASDDTDEKRRYVGSAIVVCFLFLPLQLAIGFTVAWFTPVWLSVPDEYVNTVRIAGFLLVSGPLLRNFVGIPKSVLEGENLGYKRMGLSGLLVFVGGAFTLLALYADTGLIGVAAASLATLLLTGFLYLQVARSQVPWFGIRMPKWEMAKGFVGLSGWFLIWKLIIKVLMDADVIILGILASAQLVTFYSLTKFGPELLVNFVAIVAFGSTPGLGGIIGRRDFEKARQVRGELMLLSWFVICVVGSVILLWNDSFLRLWVGPGYTASYELTLLLVAMVAQLVLIRNDANIIDMTLDLPKKIGLGAVAAIITIGLSSYLVGWRDGGAIGVCVGFLAGRSILSIGYPLIIGNKLGASGLSQLVAILRPTLFTATCFLGIYFSNTHVAGVQTWIELVGVATVSGLIVAVAAFFLGLSNSQRSVLVRRFRSVTKRFNR